MRTISSGSTRLSREVVAADIMAAQALTAAAGIAARPGWHRAAIADFNVPIEACLQRRCGPKPLADGWGGGALTRSQAPRTAHRGIVLLEESQRAVRFARYADPRGLAYPTPRSYRIAQPQRTAAAAKVRTV